MATTYLSPAVRSAFKKYPDAYVGLRGLEREQEYHELPEVLVSFVNAPLEPIIDPVFTTTTLEDGTVDVVYAATIEVEGGGAMVISLAEGTLPAGITIGSDGTVSGTPTEEGVFTFTLTATNQAAAVDQEFTLTIAAGV